jgi:two-component system sensor histidine kinase KdpD
MVARSLARYLGPRLHLVPHPEDKEASHLTQAQWDYTVELSPYARAPIGNDEEVRMQASEPSEEEIEREARVVGLRGISTPSLESVERRRLQLWGLTVLILIAVSVGVALVSTWRPAGGAVVTPTVLRIGVVLLAVAFGVYAIEKELHLRRLARLLTDQRVLTTALTNRLHEMSLLLEAGKAMNSVLELPAVLETILRSAMDLLSGESGSIMLLETPDDLVAVLARGNDVAVGRRVRVGSGIAGRVAATREALLIEGQADPSQFPGLEERDQRVMSALSVPLVSRDQLFGVLNVNASPARHYTVYDLQAASLFAEQAAGAIANARLYETERMHAMRAELGKEFGALHAETASDA